jgi:hypothetical protein
VKVTASRPQQDVNWQAAMKNRSTRETMTRRKPSFAEGSAKLYTISTAFARGEAGLKTLCTEFEDDFAHQITQTTKLSDPKIVVATTRSDEPIMRALSNLQVQDNFKK